MTKESYPLSFSGTTGNSDYIQRFTNPINLQDFLHHPGAIWITVPPPLVVPLFQMLKHLFLYIEDYATFQALKKKNKKKTKKKKRHISRSMTTNEFRCQNFPDSEFL